MPNEYFRFKKFRIEQDRCAMKVSTDACLLGALAPFSNGVERLLDVGCGTGLLSLMMAQRFAAVRIDAVEIDAEAALQARHNAEASPWGHRLWIHRCDVRTWHSPYSYDGIICNPPFFKNHWRSSEPKRNLARHDDHLSKQDLAHVVMNHLTDNGLAVVMFPASEQAQWHQVAVGAGLHLQGSFWIKPKPNKAYNRVISTWSKMPNALPKEDEWILYDEQHKLTPQAQKVLQDFYLHL